MEMTTSQKILTAHVGLEEVKAGQLIEADPDLVLGNDITSPVAINEVKKMDRKTVFGKDEIALIMDHLVPNKNIKPAESCKCYKEFTCRHEITNYFDVGDMGIEYALLPEEGLVATGDAVIGVGPHTYTYGVLGAFSTSMGSTDMVAGMVTGRAQFKVPSAIKFELVGKPSKWISDKDVILYIVGMVDADGTLYKSMEFVGEGAKALSMGDRLIIRNMIIEAGGKSRIFPVDELTVGHVKEHSKRAFTIYEVDEDTEYDETHVTDLSQLKPTVSFPRLPSSIRSIDQIGDVKMDQAVIGSCTNGRIEDIRTTVKVLEGRKTVRGVHCIVIPATQFIYLQVMREGLPEIFTEAGTVVSIPACGLCLGDYMDILTAGGGYIPTTNQNFVGRMGHVNSEIYLASPVVAAINVVAGKIICPCQLD